MKLLALIARLLLGLVFTVFGLNGFLHFLPMPPSPGLPGQFLGALAQSGYISVIFAIQLLCGVLFLVGKFVPLALTLIGPVVFNILCFHIFMAPAGLPLALITTVLWFIVFYSHRQAFASLFSQS